MMSKWSSKAADHKVVRLRNNQRRHRKRVKDHIVDLENRLAETQLQLTQARVRIAELSQKLDQARMSGNSTFLASHRTLEENSTTIHGVDRPLSHLVVRRGKDEPIVQASLPPNQAICSGGWDSNPSPIFSAPWSFEVAGQALKPGYEAFINSTDPDCCNLPLPEPGQSTTRCRDAYTIITQQNYKALDDSVIRAWLEPGFRGAFSEGDGCRIDTDLLFSLLDFISSS
ncbi:unnamed protein product [Clonostachys rosea]|uniref:BZIP domain-containing protein n=1 Tax=Bionectria ochroleuca TaxID=29856 RepID=A0ABY6UN54_BIOOC|nr:unnamed protein product [Clonostachys rosea]